MYIVDSYSLAVIFCIITMIGWGSWANTLKLSSKEWAFPLFYWDYSIGLVITTLLFGFTMGSFGVDGRGFVEDLSQASTTALGLAFIGGIIFNLANLLLGLAISISGMAVAFPIGIGLALAIGVMVNYIGDPVGNPYMLFGGLVLVVFAILFNAKAYSKLPNDDQPNKSKGILLSVFAGIMMGFFYRFVADSMISDFSNPESGFMTSYSAMFIFSLGLLVSNFLFNTWLMYRPVIGKAVTFGDYFKLGTPKLHAIGLLGGLIWCIAMELNLIASEKAGFAISYGLGQGATMVSAAWGVFIWKEFAAAKKETSKWLTAMFLFFIIGLILLVVARLN